MVSRMFDVQEAIFDDDFGLSDGELSGEEGEDIYPYLGETVLPRSTVDELTRAVVDDDGRSDANCDDDDYFEGVNGALTHADELGELDSGAEGLGGEAMVVSLMRMQMKISQELCGNLVVAMTMRVPPIAFPVTAQVAVNLSQVVMELVLSTAGRGGAVEEVLKGVVEELGGDMLMELGGDVLVEVGGDVLVEVGGDVLVDVGGDLPRICRRIKGVRACRRSMGEAATVICLLCLHTISWTFFTIHRKYVTT